ncbi:MAG: RluA family pseudouridine synthase [Pyrinomonadaceae bacterium]
MDTRLEISALEADRRKRLEDFLFERFPDLSRMYLRETIRREKCEVNGRFENRGYRLRPGDFLELMIDPRRANAMKGEDIPLAIVYEDASIVVVDKPAGMLVHPSHREKSGTLLNGLVNHLRRSAGDAARPGLPHRLDRETSGLVIVAKNPQIHRQIARQFQNKEVRKFYLAVVDGQLAQSEGTIDAPIARFPERKHWDVSETGKASITKFLVLRQSGETSLIRLEPVTGRTNQLRIHLAHVGKPIIGDTRRGGREHTRLCLHAWKLRFLHPLDRRQISFTAEPPFDILANTAE